jgi:hypothetical protein
LVHFRTESDSIPNRSGTCELKTQNLRLETITILQILVNLEKEVEEGRFYHNTNCQTTPATDCFVCHSYHNNIKQTNLLTD